MKKIPWLNEGLVGFFEMDMELYGFQLVGRNRDLLQAEVTNLLKHQNYDRACNYIKENTPIEYWNDWSEEERSKINIFELINQRINDLEYVAKIKQFLVEKGEIYPDDATIDDIGFNTREYTEDEVKELRYLVDSVPSLTQVELEDIYLREDTQDPRFLLHRKTVEDADAAAQNYETNLETSELVTQLYERNLELEAQLLSNSELLVSLYEQLNSLQNK